MKISKDGLAIIQHFEGSRNTPYQDSGYIWTAGSGHCLTPTELAKYANKTIPQSQIDLWLKNDLAVAENYIPQAITVPLTQNQYDALVSFAFNVGNAALWGSTLRKKLNKKDYQGAALELLRWNKVNGKIIEGLTRRRKVESAFFSGATLVSIEAKGWLI